MTSLGNRMAVKMVQAMVKHVSQLLSLQPLLSLEVPWQHSSLVSGPAVAVARRTKAKMMMARAKAKVRKLALLKNIHCKHLHVENLVLVHTAITYTTGAITCTTLHKHCMLCSGYLLLFTWPCIC